MAQARQLKTVSGEPLMSSDPHPLVGWARFLEWQKLTSRNQPCRNASSWLTRSRKRKLFTSIGARSSNSKTIDVIPNQLSVKSSKGHCGSSNAEADFRRVIDARNRGKQRHTFSGQTSAEIAIEEAFE